MSSEVLEMVAVSTLLPTLVVAEVTRGDAMANRSPPRAPFRSRPCRFCWLKLSARLMAMRPSAFTAGSS
ncbi:MAG: hypothetical protein V1879_03080, partial [Pseudomonadota bacterium]